MRMRKNQEQKYFPPKSPLRTMRSKWALLLFCIVLGAVLYLASISDLQLSVILRPLHLHTSDTANHIFAFFVLSWLFTLAFRPNRLWKTVAVLTLVGGGIELLQYFFVPLRMADFKDIADDVIGILLYVGVAKLIAMIRKA